VTGSSNRGGEDKKKVFYLKNSRYPTELVFAPLNYALNTVHGIIVFLMCIRQS